VISSDNYRGRKVTSLVARGAGARNICMMYAGYMTLIECEFCAQHLRQIHAGSTRNIRESDANVARTKGCYFWTSM
jgi:hypothetical protein